MSNIYNNMPFIDYNKKKILNWSFVTEVFEFFTSWQYHHIEEHGRSDMEAMAFYPTQ